MIKNVVDESSIRQNENGMEGSLEEDRDGSERLDELFDEEVTESKTDAGQRRKREKEEE